MQAKELYPYMHSVEALARRGAAIPLALAEKRQLAAALACARDWRRGAADMFLKKVSALCSVVEAPPSRLGWFVPCSLSFEEDKREILYCMYSLKQNGALCQINF